MNQSPTGGGGSAKLKRALNQLTNVERLIASLPKQYDHDKARDIALEVARLQQRIIRELTRNK